MIDLGQLPRDENGIVQGLWRIVHIEPSYRGWLGPFELRDGQSVAPVFGRAIAAVVAEYGNELFLEPWGPLDAPIDLPEFIRPEVDAEAAARFERCPWRAAEQAEGDEGEGDEDTDDQVADDDQQPEDGGTSPEVPRSKRRRR